MKEAKALKVINCQGTDYEIGQQYGKACREIFHLSSERITSFSQQCRISKKQIIANVNEFLPLVENFDPQAIEFIKGIAAGACINFEEVLMIRASMELMFFNAGRIPGLCTSFSATGKAVKSGKTLIGQNLEFFNGTSFAILRIKRADGMEQLLLAVEGSIETGINSAGIGICITANLPHHNPDHKINIPVGCYMPKLMRQRTIGNALMCSVKLLRVC